MGDEIYNVIYMRQMVSQPGNAFEGWSGSSYVREDGFIKELTQIRLMPVNDERWVAQVTRTKSPDGYYTTCTTFQLAKEWIERLHDRTIVLL